MGGQLTGQWMPFGDAAKQLGVSESTLRRRIKTGLVKAKLEGRRRMVYVQIDRSLTGQNDTMERLQAENERLWNTVKDLQKQLQEKDARHAQERERHDTIVLSLSQQLNRTRLMLDHKKESWWRRFFFKHNEGV